MKRDLLPTPAMSLSEAGLMSSPWWLPEGNSQTIWPALYARRYEGPAPIYHRERWDTPDGDFIDVDHLAGRPSRADTSPLLVLFHGLEGSSASHYAQAFAAVASQRGWGFAVPHFRGCSGHINKSPRAYHSGDHEEINWILRRFAVCYPNRPLLAVGVSLGGNALMRWAGEWGVEAGGVVCAVASVSAPLDLASAGAAIDRGFNRWIYARMFLRTMVQKARAKWKQFPGLFDLSAAERATTLYAFDDVFTAPLHGFGGTDDYWERASAKPLLSRVGVPALVLNALNDPFVPASSLPGRPDVSQSVQLWQPETGGHVGFAAPWGSGLGLPGQVINLPRAITNWLTNAAGLAHG